jgi:hypothetical protein
MSEPTAKQVDEAFDVLMKSYEDKVFSEFDRLTCTPEALRDFRALLRKRLLEERALPTVDEVDGIKILVLDYFHYDKRRPEQPYGKGQF